MFPRFFFPMIWKVILSIIMMIHIIIIFANFLKNWKLSYLIMSKISIKLSNYKASTIPAHSCEHKVEFPLLRNRISSKQCQMSYKTYKMKSELKTLLADLKEYI